MKEDRFFRVIVLGGLSLVGSPACGRDATSSSSSPDDGASVADGDVPSEGADARGDDDVVSTSGSDGGPNDLVRAPLDASEGDAGRPGDAAFVRDATSDAQACGFESFPEETALAICRGQCVPSGCPCVIPAGCTCTTCTDAAASDQ